MGSERVADHVDGFEVEAFAVPFLVHVELERVLHVLLVLAFEGRVGRLQQVNVIGVDDEVVVVGRVAHAAQAFLGCLPRLRVGHRAGADLLVVMVEHGQPDLDEVPRLFLAVFEHAAAQLQQRDGAKRQQAGQGQADQQLHSRRYAPRTQPGHVATLLFIRITTPVSFYLNTDGGNARPARPQ